MEQSACAGQCNDTFSRGVSDLDCGRGQYSDAVRSRGRSRHGWPPDRLVSQASSIRREDADAAADLEPKVERAPGGHVDLPP
jgi:hypothetical protein